MIARQGERTLGNVTLPASFTLHEADYGGEGVIAIRVHRTFSLESLLRFTVQERPAAGAVRIFSRAGEGAEPLHLAPSHPAAEAWLSDHHYPDAMLDVVTAEEAGVDTDERRVA